MFSELLPGWPRPTGEKYSTDNFSYLIIFIRGLPGSERGGNVATARDVGP